jgi:hypothetical protein
MFVFVCVRVYMHGVLTNRKRPVPSMYVYVRVVYIHLCMHIYIHAYRPRFSAFGIHGKIGNMLSKRSDF